MEIRRRHNKKKEFFKKIPNFWFKILPVILSLALLSGCNWYTDSDAYKKPLPHYLVKSIKDRGFKLGARILARIYKQENRFELWMEKDGKFEFFKSYGICSWSGELGPKLKEGDRQAPEGFYVVTPAQMNPRSKFHLSFNLGYPNFYDRARGRTGSHLMVHGACSSRGCYALTNSSIEQVYLLARDAFKNGQRRFQVHALPFRLNKANLEKYKDHKWIDFWKNLAEGDTLFLKTGQIPKMAVVNKRYVFAAANQTIKTTTTTKDDKNDPISRITKPVEAPADLWAYYSKQPIDSLIKDEFIKLKLKPKSTNANEFKGGIPTIYNDKIDTLKDKADKASLYNGTTPTNSR
ncbi:MAG: murein L,D-transpeptidase [Rhizobiales bacterium]|nr:murein L,D-transpeptidase [Hyphomicrobiales bacterium]